MSKQTAQSIYEITVWEEMARVNDIAGTITMLCGVQSKLADKAVLDSTEGTFVWLHSKQDCPENLVSIYVGPIKIYTNSVVCEPSSEEVESAPRP